MTEFISIRLPCEGPGALWRHTIEGYTFEQRIIGQVGYPHQKWFIPGRSFGRRIKKNDV